jgi:hypothetical protein
MTWRSDPQAEWEETRVKARGPLTAIGAREIEADHGRSAEVRLAQWRPPRSLGAAVIPRDSIYTYGRGLTFPLGTLQALRKMADGVETDHPT